MVEQAEMEGAGFENTKVGKLAEEYIGDLDDLAELKKKLGAKQQKLVDAMLEVDKTTLRIAGKVITAKHHEEKYTVSIKNAQGSFEK